MLPVIGHPRRCATYDSHSFALAALQSDKRHLVFTITKSTDICLIYDRAVVFFGGVRLMPGKMTTPYVN